MRFSHEHRIDVLPAWRPAARGDGCGLDRVGLVGDLAGDNMTAFALHNVTLGYDGHPAVHHLEGTFAEGSLTAVIGPNGSGKSTLLKGLAGLLSPIDGHIHRTGFAPQDIAYLPQAGTLDLGFPATVADLVGLGLWRKRGLFQMFRDDDASDIKGALADVGLSGFEDRAIDTLSGGQLQRALFARVMLQDARVILLDEPFTAIDARTVADLLHLVQHWHGERRTVIAVLHDDELVRKHFPQAILLAREAVAWGATHEALRPDNLLKAQHMHEAWDDAAPWCAPAQAHQHHIRDVA
jgi:zinc/manganese transport system ATP-binding protein